MSTSRLDWDDYFIDLAQVVKERSTCSRRKVGAVITDPSHRVVSVGYNGSLPGQPHCSDAGCQIENGHCIGTIHAEVNAVVASSDLKRCAGATIYVDAGTPCFQCAKLLILVGIKRVVGVGDYVSAPAIKLFKDNDVELEVVKEVCRGSI